MSKKIEKIAIQNGKIVTFYSYKGGVGRSMALANMACLLAKQGKKVLMIDWDIEAPGLHQYFKPYIDNNNSFENFIVEKNGLLEYFLATAQKLPAISDEDASEKDIQILNDALNDIQDYIYSIKINKQHNIDIDFLKAGRLDQNYGDRIDDMDWGGFYKKLPYFFINFAYFLKKRYDYILIDSRTGHTDTGGICTMLMPEKLVLVYTPNQQSLDGVLKLGEKAANYRKNSGDLRPLTIYPLPSRVELGEESLRIQWKESYNEKFTALYKNIYNLPNNISLNEYFDSVQLRHVPRYAYGEDIAVLVENGNIDTITLGYKNLLEYFEKEIWGVEQVYIDIIDSEVSESTLPPNTLIVMSGEDHEIIDTFNVHLRGAKNIFHEYFFVNAPKGKRVNFDNYEKILIMLSPSLLSSDYFIKYIYPQIEPSKKIILVKLKTCFWEDHFNFQKYVHHTFQNLQNRDFLNKSDDIDSDWVNLLKTINLKPKQVS